MEFSQTISREFLQNEQVRFKELLRIQSVMQHVNKYSHMIVEKARDGKTQYTIEVRNYRIQLDNCIVTVDDLLEGYRLKFPDCKVDYKETWEPCLRNPNQMNKKSGIIIDWS